MTEEKQNNSKGELEKTLYSLRCPSCNQISDFEYIGKQEHPTRPSILYYNCLACKSSISLGEINKYNEK
jgi:hypothetical protein